MCVIVSFPPYYSLAAYDADVHGVNTNTYIHHTIAREDPIDRNLISNPMKIGNFQRFHQSLIHSQRDNIGCEVCKLKKVNDAKPKILGN